MPGITVWGAAEEQGHGSHLSNAVSENPFTSLHCCVTSWTSVVWFSQARSLLSFVGELKLWFLKRPRWNILHAQALTLKGPCRAASVMLKCVVLREGGSFSQKERPKHRKVGMSQSEESKSRNCESDHRRWYLLLWKDSAIHLFRKMLQLNIDYQPVGNFKCRKNTTWKFKLKKTWVGQRRWARRWVMVLFFPQRLVKHQAASFHKDQYVDCTTGFVVFGSQCYLFLSCSGLVA